MKRFKCTNVKVKLNVRSVYIRCCFQCCQRNFEGALNVALIFYFLLCVCSCKPNHIPNISLQKLFLVMFHQIFIPIANCFAWKLYSFIRCLFLYDNPLFLEISWSLIWASIKVGVVLDQRTRMKFLRSYDEHRPYCLLSACLVLPRTGINTLSLSWTSRNLYHLTCKHNHVRDGSSSCYFHMYKSLCFGPDNFVWRLYFASECF